MPFFIVEWCLTRFGKKSSSYTMHIYMPYTPYIYIYAIYIYVYGVYPLIRLLLLHNTDRELHEMDVFIFTTHINKVSGYESLLMSYHHHIYSSNCQALNLTNRVFIFECSALLRRSALLGQATAWLAQCQDKVTEWDIRSLVSAAWFPSKAAL